MEQRMLKPKFWFIVFGALSIVMILFITTKLANGVDTEELNTAQTEMNALKARLVEKDNEAYLADRETQIIASNDIRTNLANDLVSVLENKDYDAFESKYGETLRIVVESETTDTEFKNVRVEEEPMDYALNEYHMNIVFDNSLQILLHYDFNNDLYIPNYVNLMGGA